MPDTAPATEMGLRDRKRIETRNRIAEAARSLALEQDIDRTTIEQIAARAEVSPRTFFNYFESKEDAVLRHTELDLDPATLDAHLAAVAGSRRRRPWSTWRSWCSARRSATSTSDSSARRSSCGSRS